MDKEIKGYLSSVKRRLNLPKDIRTRLLSDLETTIAARMEQGEDWPSIRQTLGSPAQVAAEYTEQMKEFAYRKSPWRFVPLVVAIGLGLWTVEKLMVMAVGVYLLHREAASIGIIGGADGPTAIFVTSTGHSYWWLLLAALLTVGTILLYLRLRKCKNKENSL